MVIISQQVDILLTQESWGSTSSFIRCSDVAPGVCCAAPNRAYLSFPTAIFRNLDALDIAAVWDSDERSPQVPTNGAPDLIARTIGACSGRVIDSRAGPGTWTWDTVDPDSNEYFPVTFVSGGSYIRLPEYLPPNPRLNRALSVQGILGLAWGGGKWFASPAAESLLGGRSRSVPRRDIRSATKGDVYARPPRTLVYPNLMRINGTEYTMTISNAEEVMYINGDTGRIFNLTDWFVRL